MVVVNRYYIATHTAVGMKVSTFTRCDVGVGMWHVSPQNWKFYQISEYKCFTLVYPLQIYSKFSWIVESFLAGYLLKFGLFA